MVRSLLLILVLVAVGCGDSTGSNAIDPYALFYVKNDRTDGPIWYGFVRFPNRTPVANSYIGSAGPGEVLCSGFGLETAVPGDPENDLQVVGYAYRGDSVINPVVDSLKSPVVDPFALGANTPTTAHRFRLWLKADGTQALDFGLYNETEKWAAEPGWPCPTTF